MSVTETTTTWRLKGTGYEFCNCQPGCTCNFNGFPTSPDGSCKAAVANRITEGNCGDVDLSGVTALMIIDWPKAIHDGNGKAVFVVPPEVSDQQLDALAQIYTGQLGGMPWAILGTTYEVAGVVRADVDLDDDGINSGFRVPGVGEAKGTTLSTGYRRGSPRRNRARPRLHLETRRLRPRQLRRRGGKGIHLSFKDSNWILYDFDWTNDE